MNLRPFRFLLVLGLVTASSAAMAQQVCSSNVPLTAPDSRYTVDAANGVATDNQTGLMWKQCPEGLSGSACDTGAFALRVTWANALAAADAANTTAFAGHDDWRLPNIIELQSLVESSCYGPAINATVFPTPTLDSGVFWSSTTHAQFPGSARVVAFSYGNLDSYADGNTLYVRLVRGGQWLDTFDSETVQTQTVTFNLPAPTVVVGGSGTVMATTTATPAGNYPILYSTDSTDCSVDAGTGDVIGIHAGTDNCIIDATQAGDSTYLEGTATLTLSIGKGSQTITFTSTAPTTAVVGGSPYSATATGGASGNAVTFTIDAAATSVCSISSGVVSFTGAGTCVIDANQAGDGNYNAAPQAQQSFAVGKDSQTITFTSAAPTNAAVGGATYTVTATASSGLAATFTTDAAASSVCSISGSTVSFTGVGTCVIDANQAGNGNYNAAPQVQQTFAVGKGTPTITTLPSASPITYGQTLADSTLSGGVASVPGTFAFTMPSTMPNAGTQSEPITFAPTDTTNYANADASIIVNVARAKTTTTLATACMTTFVDVEPAQPFTVSATVLGVDPTGGVTFSDNTAGVLCDGSIQLVDGIATCTTNGLAAGTHLIVAIYDGDANHETSASVGIAVNVLDGMDALFRNDFDDVTAGCPVE